MAEVVEGSKARRIERWLDLVVIAVLGALAYGNALQGGYHLDDVYRIAENTELERVWPPWRHFLDPATSATLPTIVQYRPLLPLSLSLTTWVADAIGIERIVAHHLGNLLLHVTAAWLVSRLFRAIAERCDPRVPARGLGLAAGAMYAVHPIAGVPVNYLCARDLQMMQVFLLASLVVHVRMPRDAPSPGRWALGLGLVGLSLLAKTDAVVAPALVGAIEVAVFGASLRGKKTWMRAGAFVLPVLAFFTWTELVLGFSDADQLVIDRAPLEYPLTQARIHVTVYLRNFVWPFLMRPLPRVEPASGLADLGAWIGIVLVAGSIAAAWRLRGRAPIVALCIVAYWICFAPTSWFLPFRYLATDYRQVPSLPWLCGAVAWLVLRGLPRRESAIVIALFVLYFGGASILLNRIWRDEAALWGHTVRHGGEVQAHVNYGRAIAATDPDLAQAHYEEALRRAPDNVFALINLGLLEISRGGVERGIARLEQAARIAPQWEITKVWLLRGCQAAEARVGRRDDASMPGLARCRARLRQAFESRDASGVGPARSRAR